MPAKKDDLEGSEAKLIIKVRNVLWREVERGGNPKGLGRACVYLPLEAVDILGLQDRGVAFVMKKKPKEVMLTNYFGSQPAMITKSEQDPQVLLDRLIAQVLVLKSKKSEVSEKWESHEIDDGEYILKTKEINRRLEDIRDNIKKILDSSFRGPSDALGFMQNKIKSFYDEYKSIYISYTEDLVSKIHSLEKAIHALDSAHSKGLFNDDYEYQYEKNELVSQFNSFKDLAVGIVQLLTQSN